MLARSLSGLASGCKGLRVVSFVELDRHQFRHHVSQLSDLGSSGQLFNGGGRGVATSVSS